MRQLAFCEYCMNKNMYKIYTVNKTSILNNEKIEYKAEEAICSNCGNEVFVSEICDNNLNNLYNQFRKKHKIICSKEIKHILIKYSIDEASLSLLLGLKKDTICRYLNGDMVANSHSDILIKMYDNPNYYSILLQTNKEKINPVSYNKSRQAVKYILDNKMTEGKIDAVIKYLLIRCEDFTQAALYSYLYYVQAFHFAFTKRFIFEEDCEANINGLIYRSVFERYEKYGYDEVNKEILANKDLKLEDVERNVVEGIIKFYSCYSGKILKQMIHNEAPWILTASEIGTKNNLNNESENKIIDKNLIEEYFNGIKEKYNMINLLDIQKYSNDLFHNISM